MKNSHRENLQNTKWTFNIAQNQTVGLDTRFLIPYSYSYNFHVSSCLKDAKEHKCYTTYILHI